MAWDDEIDRDAATASVASKINNDVGRTQCPIEFGPVDGLSRSPRGQARLRRRFDFIVGCFLGELCLEIRLVEAKKNPY